MRKNTKRGGKFKCYWVSALTGKNKLEVPEKYMRCILSSVFSKEEIRRWH